MNQTSIIILTYNHFNYTKDCIESIFKYTKKGTYEIIVVDNHSTDNTREWLKKQKDIKVIFNLENVGFPKGCNQAIKIANSKNDILLLNNDTIVTENWLENLQTCLHSDSKIGAVGSVCNHDENLQGISFTYNDFKEMQKKASENNISNKTRWEEKVFLIGFCLLIKRKVMNKIKRLDENYSPGYVEDNDLSLKIIQNNYKLMLCHDSFIHHYLGSAFRENLEQFYPILNKNRKYFQKKWGFSTTCFDDLKTASFLLLEHPKKILDIGCGIGTNLLKLKYMYPHAIIHGVEENPKKRKIAKKFGKIYSSLSKINEDDYDVILIGNLLEQIDDIEYFLKKIRIHLTEHGFIIGEIHNIANMNDIEQLLEDHWYFNHQKQKQYFTIHDIYQLFFSNEYHSPLMYFWNIPYTEHQKEKFQLLHEIDQQDYSISYYSFRFQK